MIDHPLALIAIFAVCLGFVGLVVTVGGQERDERTEDEKRRDDTLSW